MYNIDAVQAMAFDGCYHDSEIDMDQTSLSLNSEDFMRRKSIRSPSTDSTWIKRRKSLGGHVGRIILENNHVIDTYSRILFPVVYILFNLFYWGVYVWRGISHVYNFEARRCFETKLLNMRWVVLDGTGKEPVASPALMRIWKLTYLHLRKSLGPRKVGLHK